MAEQKDKDQPAEAPKRAGPGLLGMLMWMITSIVAVTAGLATPYVVNQLRGASAPSEAAASAATGTALPIPKATGEVAYIRFGETVVNLDSGRLNRYLRIAIALQVDKSQEEAINQLIETRRIVLKNWLIGFLSDRDMEEIRGAAGQNRLRREIQDYFNATLFPDGYDRIQDVLFEEFNVQ